MAQSDYQIIIGAAGVEAMLAAAPGVVKTGILEQLELGAEMVKTELQKEAPVGVTGNLQATISYNVSSLLMAAEIKPDAEYGDAVETGSKPHWVSAKPGSPLAMWAELKGMNVYALQHSIAQRGTQPHPYIVPTYERVGPYVVTQFAAGLGVLIEELQHVGV